MAVLVLLVVVGVVAWIAATGGGSDDGGSASPTSTTEGGVSNATGLTSPPGIATVGSEAPGFDLSRLRGPGRVDLASLRGRVVVVNFWASWCIACRKEFPELRQVQREFRGRPVTIVGIASRDIASDARAFASEHAATWSLVTDERGKTAVDYGVRALPQTFFVGPDGVIAQRYFAAPTRAEFTAEIERLLPAS